MHELSICASIADIVTRHAQERTVEVIRVRIGQLRQVVPETLVYCWTLVSEDTPLDGSRIEVESVPARLRCRGCGAEREVGPYPVFVCESCDSTKTEVIAGEEFLITSLELTGA